MTWILRDDLSGLEFHWNRWKTVRVVMSGMESDVFTFSHVPTIDEVEAAILDYLRGE